MLPYEREAEESISTHLASEFADMARLHNVAVALFAGLTLPASGADRVTVYTVAGLFAKVCKTFRAIEHLCARGLGQDATVLARSLYEAAIAILFLLQKRGCERQRVAMYHANTLNAEVRMLSGWEETPGSKAQGQEGSDRRHSGQPGRMGRTAASWRELQKALVRTGKPEGSRGGTTRKSHLSGVLPIRLAVRPRGRHDVSRVS